MIFIYSICFPITYVLYLCQPTVSDKKKQANSHSSKICSTKRNNNVKEAELSSQLAIYNNPVSTLDPLYCYAVESNLWWCVSSDDIVVIRSAISISAFTGLSLGFGLHTAVFLEVDESINSKSPQREERECCRGSGS